jgi:hypothetical protein
MTPFHAGGTPSKVSFYTTRRDATAFGQPLDNHLTWQLRAGPADHVPHRFTDPEVHSGTG